MKRTPLIALLGTSLLSACGGGSDSSPPAPETPVTTASVALSGTAAKGLMANADVKVHPVKADGSVDLATTLASATTGADGKYSLSFTGTKDQPYVVRVSATANTTHRDEVTGQAQPLPVGFAMRTVVTPAATGAVTTSASITPFSEMAVAAAAKASGGVTAANAAQAVSTVSQLLGFDPIKVAATTATTAASDDEKKLAVMLTAVSQMASSGDLGCSTGEAGDKVRCVVDKLGEAATTTSIKLERSGDDSSSNVSAVLGNAVNTVLAKPELVGSISGSLLTTVAANLACTTNCTAASTGTTPTVDALALAITGAKLLFTQLKSDWTALFSRGGATALATGAANVQAFKFDGALRDAQVPLATMVNDTATMLTGIDLYNDYKAGRTTQTSRIRAQGLAPSDGWWPFQDYPASGCALYQDSANTVVATSVDNAVSIGCSARYYLAVTFEENRTVINEYRHGFTITPRDDGSFGWQTRARLRRSTGATVLSNAALQLDASGNPIEPFTGTVTPTLSNGRITAFSLSGELAGAFANGGTTLVNHKHAITASGTRTISAVQEAEQVSNLSGTLVAKNASGATLSTLQLKDGVLKTQPVSRDAEGNAVAPTAATAVDSWGGTLSALTANLVFTTADAELDVLLSLPTSAWDKSGTLLEPTELRAVGMLRNISNGVSTEFLKGTFSARSTGFGSFDALQAPSATNNHARSLSFVGEVTAPGRPLLSLSLGAEQLVDNLDGGTVQSMTLQYRSIVNGTPRLVVNLGGSRDAATGGVRLRLTEASANLSMTWQAGASSVELVQGDSRVIGSVSRGGLVTFADGSLVSLDIGL